MGQRFTKFLKLLSWSSSEPNAEPSAGSTVASLPVSVQLATEEYANRKYPLPLEALMLRQIKTRYSAKDSNRAEVINSLVGSTSSNSRNIDKEEHISHEEIMTEQLCRIIQHSMKRDNAEMADSICNNLRDKLQIVENKNYEAQLTLIDFPILVVEKLLPFLNPTSVLNLRLTCKGTKAWIDNNSYILRKFQLRLDPGKCKGFQPPYTATWSNFAIPYSQLQSEFIQETIDNYSSVISTLDIYAPQTITSVSTSYPPNHPNCLFGILKRCKKIEKLTICRLDTFTQVEDNCLGNLRSLCIDRIQWMNHSDFLLFENIITQCPHLEYLKIPQFEILGSLAFIFYDTNASPEKEHLIRPIIRYLDLYRAANSSTTIRSRSRKLYIDVVEFEDFKLCSSEIFYELSRKCVECRAVLMNVYFVPRDAVVRNQQDIVESFASMFGFIKIDFRAELWKNLEVMECWIEDFPEDFDLTMRQLSFLKTISKISTLRSLTIRLSVDEPEICSTALGTCVGQDYGGVQKLILRRHHVNPENNVLMPPEFGSAFSNLRFLYLQELDSKNEDIQELWVHLPKLEELFIYKCPYFTQDAFLGVSQSGVDNKQKPPILHLTKLQVMVVFLHDGVDGFTDEFLLKALRYMRLKGFAVRGTAGVEFTDVGMMSLLNSSFHDTVEDFEASSVLFRPTISPNYWKFYVALPKKELRRNRLWLSCSVLLNSLTSRKHRYNFKSKCLAL